MKPEHLDKFIASECPGYEIETCEMVRDFAMSEVVILVRIKPMLISKAMAAEPAEKFAKPTPEPDAMPCGPWPFERRTSTGAMAKIVPHSASAKAPKQRDDDVLALWNTGTRRST